MLTVISNSFITASRMDGFSYVQSPAGASLLAEAPRRSTEQPKSVLARVFATLRPTLAGIF